MSYIFNAIVPRNVQMPEIDVYPSYNWRKIDLKQKDIYGLKNNKVR